MEPFDCEMLRDGALTQPINALSAIAFVVVAVFLWNRGRGDVAIFSASAGIGSVWFHADPGGASQWAHDITLYALVAVGLLELWQRIAAQDWPVLAIGVFLAGLVFWAIGRTGSPFCDPDSLVQWHAVWHVLAAVAVLILFRPDSVGADL